MKPSIKKSGLLAAAAAQLLVYFKADGSFSDDINSGGPGGAKGFVIASCYAALFLNVSATISSFILIDNLGEIGFRASCKGTEWEKDIQQTERIEGTQENLLVRFGASKDWNLMLLHCKSSIASDWVLILSRRF